jgi:MYXO-CTERM domain-containing protein
VQRDDSGSGSGGGAFAAWGALLFALFAGMRQFRRIRFT